MKVFSVKFSLPTDLQKFSFSKVYCYVRYFVSNKHNYRHTVQYLYICLCMCLTCGTVPSHQVNELRNQGDEIAREMAMLGGDRENASQERRGFEELMKLVSF